LDIALHRLRNLVGRDDAILVSDGKLTLNEKIVWVDVWAFETMQSTVEEAVKSTADALPSSEQLTEKIWRLYQGHFLDREGDQPWMLGAREKLRSKFRRCLLLLGRRWEDEGNWDNAAALYRRGLELDNLAEDLYRRLMIAHQKRGQSADMVEVYRRCRQMLSVVLGMKPSAETEALYQSLKNN
jgi:DNA-binding SARP family transcriptional activator